MNNANKPINPSSFIENPWMKENFHKVTHEIGLTKREYASIEAMKALISNPNIKRPSSNDAMEYDKFCKVAIEYADALLKQLETE